MTTIDTINEKAAALVAEANTAISHMADIHARFAALEVERFENARLSVVEWPEPFEVMGRIRDLARRCSVDAAWRAEREAVRS